MLQVDYDNLSKAIVKAVLDAEEDSYPKYTDYQVKGLSDMRYRWDLLHFSGYNVRPLYQYLNDDHIDTALRMITRTKK
jgi:hypothetical protein